MSTLCRLLRACPVERGETIVCLCTLGVVSECLRVKVDRLRKRETLLAFGLVREILERPRGTLPVDVLPTTNDFEEFLRLRDEPDAFLLELIVTGDGLFCLFAESS